MNFMGEKMVRYWLFAVAVIAVSPVRAAPTVCDASSYVGDQIPGSLDLQVSLSEDGKSYPVKVRSDVTTGYARNVLCFQYQLVNSGTEKIPLAFWNLVDDYKAADLDAQQSRFRNRSRPTTFDDPVKAPTKVKGLRSAETGAIAWRTVEDANKNKEANAGSAPSFSFAKASSLDGAVARAVKSGLLPDEDVAVFDYKAAQGKASSVSDLVSLDLGSVYSTSSVDFKERASSFTLLKVNVNASSGRSTQTEVRIFSPFLSALGKEPKETNQFLDLVSQYTKEPAPILATSKVAGERIPSGNFDYSQTFYVVEHPLTIEWSTRDTDGRIKTTVQCIRIASYSPFPVSLNDKFCVR